MTATIDVRPASGPAGAAGAVHVAALIHVTDSIRDHLGDTLGRLLGTVIPDQVVLLDATTAGLPDGAVADHPVAKRARVGTHRLVAGVGARTAYNQAVAAEGVLGADISALWLLAAGQRPDAEALGALVDVLRRSTSTGIAAPKVLDLPGAHLRSVGISATRTGRVLALPAPGEPDMGQFDGRGDILAAPVAGLLVRRDLFRRIGGFHPEFGDLGGDLDFAWRAHAAGSRVLLADRARLRSEATDLVVTIADTGARRRAGRRVALARSAWWAAPFLALWIAGAGVLAALGLLLLKRPRAALGELAALGALLDPWRSIASRWRARGTRSVRRRDLSSLFLDRGDVLRHGLDRAHQALGTERVETLSGAGPVGDQTVDRGALTRRVLRHSGSWAVLAVIVTTAAAWRGVGGRLGAFSTGLAGGELIPSRTTPSALVQDWWIGWSGAGLGTPGRGTLLGPLLALPTYLLGHLPYAAPANPSGAAVTLLVAAAMPLSAATAYVAGRAATRTRWVRALAALAWATSAPAFAAVREGRIGALVLLIVGPLVLAGIVATLTGRAGTPLAALTGLGGAVLTAFTPAVVTLAIAALVVGVVVAPGAAKLRSALAAALPVAAFAPHIPGLVDHPARVLAGPGLLTSAPTPPLRDLVALAPGGSSLPWYAAAPLVAVGVLSLLRPGRRSWGVLGGGLLAVLGLALTLAAPRLTLATAPLGGADAGAALRPWWGTGMLIALAGVLGATLVGLDRIGFARGRRLVVVLPVAGLLATGALGSAALVGFHGIDGRLTAWAEPRPAVAIDQAEGPLANRSLILAPSSLGTGFQLVGVENPNPARSLPRENADSALTARVVQSLLEPGDGDPRAGLVGLGIGFLAIDADTDPQILQRLDGTQGLIRMGDRDGRAWWRVAPPDGPTDNSSVGTARVTLTDNRGTVALPVDGGAARLSASVTAEGGGLLRVAQPQDWADRAAVTVDGTRVTARTGDFGPEYVVAAGGHDVRIEVGPSAAWARWAQLGVLLVALYLAIPTSRTVRRPQ